MGKKLSDSIETGFAVFAFHVLAGFVALLAAGGTLLLTGFLGVLGAAILNYLFREGIFAGQSWGMTFFCFVFGLCGSAFVFTFMRLASQWSPFDRQTLLFVHALLFSLLLEGGLSLVLSFKEDRLPFVLALVTIALAVQAGLWGMRRRKV